MQAVFPGFSPSLTFPSKRQPQSAYIYISPRSISPRIHFSSSQPYSSIYLGQPRAEATKEDTSETTMKRATAPTDGSNPSASAVFATVELLEYILVHLPMLDLLTNAQRVNRHWKGTIKGSPCLQRKLYLQPELQEKGFLDCDRVANPLLEDVVPFCYQQHPDVLNYQMLDLTGLEVFSIFSNTNRKSAFLCPKASWRLMLFSQPPPLRLGLWKSYPEPGDLPRNQDSRQSFKIQTFPQGLRMGTLYDRFVELMSSSEYATTMIHSMPRNGFFADTLEMTGPPVLALATVSHLEAMEEESFKKIAAKVDILCYRHCLFYVEDTRQNHLERNNNDTYMSSFVFPKESQHTEGNELLIPAQDSKEMSLEKLAEKLEAGWIQE